MIKKVIRPFWSLDVMKTETWLSEMAISEYRLQKVNLITREFIFENDESKTIYYRICRHKAGISTTSQSLIRNQWYSVFTKGKWSILANENEASELKIFPSRESILKRNRTMKYSIGILLAYLAFTQIQTIFIFTVILSANGFSPFLSPWFIISRLLVVFLLSYIIVKLNQSDKQIRMENGSDLTLPSTILYGKTERTIRKEGKLIKKIKFAWTYAPDKIEDWLENMEMKGYNLVRINWLGTTFNFIKGESRTIKYCVDYQNFVNDSYFEMHNSNGWEMLFTSKLALTKYTIWRKEYTDHRSELYSDKSQILKHARKQCLLYCVLFIPIIFMYIASIVSMVRMTSTYPDMPFSWTTPIIFALAVVEYGYFTLQSLGYYLRTRKRINC
jgi:hypothetical protein